MTSSTVNKTFCIKKPLNFNCKSQKYADIEYISKSGRHFVIEAKSHYSKDRDNGVHKLFGELLKETGRRSRSDVLGVLLTDGSRKGRKIFYREKFHLINKNAYLAFGKLVRCRYVFLLNVETQEIRLFSWSGFYRGDKERGRLSCLDQ